MFEKYPKIPYPLDGKYYTVTDITTRLKLVMSQNEIVKLTDIYVVNDGETPELISNKIYGTPFYHWTIFFINNIFDYVNDWVKTDDQLFAYCADTYGETGMFDPRYKVNDYGFVFQNGDPRLTAFNENTNDAIINTGSSLSIINNYQYEQLLNERKRNIRVIRPEYISTFISTFNKKLGE